MEEFVTDLISEDFDQENAHIIDIREPCQEPLQKPCLVRILYCCQDWCCIGLMITIIVLLMGYLTNFKYVDEAVLNATD
jgi:hypothetical protein